MKTTGLLLYVSLNLYCTDSSGVDRRFCKNTVDDTVNHFIVFRALLQLGTVFIQ